MTSRTPIDALCTCAVFAAAAIAYLNMQSGLPGPFLIDDVARITNMSIVNLTPEMLALAIEAADSGHLGRPISLASLYVTKYFHGDDAGAFKHENILYHLVTGLLLYWLTYRLTAALNRHALSARTCSPAIIAACVSIFWLLHPLHVSTVLYAVQRMTILSTMFTACALLTYVAARDGPLRSARGLLLMLGLFPAFILLAMFSKEDGALIPVYVLLIEALVFRFATTDRREYLLHRGVLLALVAAPIAIGTAYFALNADSLLHDYVMRRFSLSERLASEAVIVWRYAGMILLPRLSEMSLFHDAAPIYSLRSLPALLGIVGWIAVVATLVAARRRAPLIVFGIAFFLAAHLLESTVLPLELMFEHRNYLASYGLLLAAVEGARQLLALARIRPSATIAVVAAFVGIFGFLQYTRASVWSDRESLIPVIALEHPRSVRAASALANIYSTYGDDDKAIDVLERALTRSDPYYHLSLRLHQLGLACKRDDRFPAELYNDALRRIASEPLMAYALSGLHVLVELVTRNRCPSLDTEQVIELVQVALGNPNTRRRSAFNLHSDLAALHASRGEFQEAATEYEKALQSAVSTSRPSVMRAAIALTDLYIELEQWDKARSTIERNRDMMSSGDLSLIGAGKLIDKQLDAIPESRSN